jgi:serine acetyltransferase
MSLKDDLKADIKANTNNPKGKAVVFCYRIANHLHLKRKNIFFRIIGFPIIKLYRITFIWLLGIEVPDTVSIGRGFQMWHGTGLVINPATIIGTNVLLRHTTTIGNKYSGSGCPVIGNNVEIGAHTIIIGDVSIGDNVTIGAGSIVTKSIPANSIAYGNPLKIIEKKEAGARA